MFDNIANLIRNTLNTELHPNLKKCYDYGINLPEGEVRDKIRVKYREISANIDRLSICLEILQGNAYAFHDENAGLKITMPKPGIIAGAVKQGAVVTSIELNKQSNLL